MSDWIPMCPKCRTAQHLTILTFQPLRLEQRESRSWGGDRVVKRRVLEPTASYCCGTCGYHTEHVVSRDWRPASGI